MSAHSENQKNIKHLRDSGGAQTGEIEEESRLEQRREGEFHRGGVCGAVCVGGACEIRCVVCFAGARESGVGCEREGGREEGAGDCRLVRGEVHGVGPAEGMRGGHGESGV